MKIAHLKITATKNTEFPRDGNTFSGASCVCMCLPMSPAFDSTHDGNLRTHVLF